VLVLIGILKGHHLDHRLTGVFVQRVIKNRGTVAFILKKLTLKPREISI
jgi:hypothetical protein